MTVTTPTHHHTNALIAQGYRVVAGVDEVGRGCLAGPVVAAAVILLPKSEFPGLNDSKILTPLRRHNLAAQIKRQAAAIGIGWVSSDLIDANGLTWALSRAATLALSDMNTAYDAVLLDGAHNYMGAGTYVQTVVKGDSICLNIAAASVIAKVARDNYMHLQHRLYPSYGFDRHVGYGTLQHLKALQGGISPLHRRLFKPVKKLSSYGLTGGSLTSSLEVHKGEASHVN